MRRRPDLVKQNAPQTRSIKPNALQARIFDAVLMVLCLIHIVCNLFFTNHSSKYSSFNELMN